MKVRFLPLVVVILAAGLVVPFFSAQSAAQALTQSGSPELAKFFSQYFEERLRDEPEFATNVGRHEYDDHWADLSKQGRDLRRTHLEAALANVEKNTGGQTALSEQDQLSVKLLRYDLRTQLDALDLQTYLLRVGQMTGFHNSVYLVVDRMPSFTV